MTLDNGHHFCVKCYELPDPHEVGSKLDLRTRAQGALAKVDLDRAGAHDLLEYIINILASDEYEVIRRRDGADETG